MTIRVHDSEVMGELDRLTTLNRAAYELEVLLSRQYQATQMAVHVDTGSLKRSGDIDSEWSEDGVWTGTVSYGGPAPGMPNNPVTYAIYEQARGGDHDFMADAYDMGRSYRRIVSDHVAGR